MWDFSSLTSRTCYNIPGVKVEATEHLFGVMDVVTKYVLDDFSTQVLPTYLHLSQCFQEVCLVRQVGATEFHPAKPLVFVTDGSVVRLYNLDTGVELVSLSLLSSRFPRTGVLL